MKTKIVTVCCSVLVVALVIFTSGCATPALWKSTAARNWNPSSPDQIILITSKDNRRDALIVFHQVAASGDTDSRIAAWRISQPTNQLTLTKAAIHQLTNSFDCQAIPMLGEDEVCTSVLPPAGYAVWDSAQQQLTIHAADVPSGPFSLPTWQQRPQIGVRMCVLPIAIATDAALVGAAALFMCLASGAYVGT